VSALGVDPAAARKKNVFVPGVSPEIRRSRVNPSITVVPHVVDDGMPASWTNVIDDDVFTLTPNAGVCPVIVSFEDSVNDASTKTSADVDRVIDVRMVSDVFVSDALPENCPDTKR
jgi:hypothetical protein